MLPLSHGPTSLSFLGTFALTQQVPLPYWIWVHSDASPQVFAFHLCYVQQFFRSLAPSPLLFMIESLGPFPSPIFLFGLFQRPSKHPYSFWVQLKVDPRVPYAIYLMFTNFRAFYRVTFPWTLITDVCPIKATRSFELTFPFEEPFHFWPIRHIDYHLP